MYNRSTLDNGVRIVTETIPYVRSVSIGFWLRVGSRDETPHDNGICHFIEHLMFKGTHSRTARDIAETIDSAGGQLNAFTSKEHTCYYVRVLDEHLGLATDLLADMLLHSAFSEVEIEKEKGVIAEEIKMYEDSPDELIHDLFTAAVLGRHPLGKAVLGTVGNVEAMSRRHLLAFVNHYYTAGNLVVAAAGNVAHEQVVEEVARLFSVLGGQATPQPDAPPDPPGHRSIRVKDTEQVHLCVGAAGLPRNDPDKYALFILDTLLGGGMSSRLFQELREERGLVYSTYSYHACFQDTGIFAVYAGTSPANAAEVVELIHRELADVGARGVRPDELARAKEQLKGSLMLSLESTTSRMSRLAKAELAPERLLTPDEVIARIHAVQPEDVHRVASRLFRPEQLTLAAIGPVPAELGAVEKMEAAS